MHFSGSRFDRDRDTTSQDSGISQMSVGNDKNDINGITETDSNNLGNNFYICYVLIVRNHILDDEAIVKAALECCLIDNPTSLEEKQKLLQQLKGLIEAGQVTHIIPNFK